MEIITATRDTLLKKQPVQSISLPDYQKKAVSRGKSYSVEEYTYIGENHYKVVLGNNMGTWFIFDTSKADSHWECSWEDTHENEDRGEDTFSESRETNRINNPGQIDWSNPNIYISEYFRTIEVTKNDPNRFPKPNSNEEKDILKLAIELDKLREDWDSPLIVTSWFRPSTRLGYRVDVNQRVHGAFNSQHIYGRGVDIYPSNGKLAELQNLCLQHWRGGVGKGLPKGFVHLDTRSGTPAWKAGSPTIVWIYGV